MAISAMKLRWILTFYIDAEPLKTIPPVELHSTAGKDTLDWMLKEQLIVRSGNGYDLLPRLEVFVDHLKSLHLPIPHWTMGKNKD